MNRNPWGSKVPGAAPVGDELEPLTGPVTSPSEIAEAERIELAQSRFQALTNSFASLMGIIAQMHQEEDWRYLTKEDGSGYSSLAEVVADALNLSAAMARRYVQGAKHLYIPLSAVAIEGTEILIDSTTVRDLGIAGAGEVVQLASERLEGIEDPEEAAEVIQETLKEVRQKPDPNASVKDESGSFYDDDGVFFDQEVMAGTPACGQIINGEVCYFPLGHTSPCSPLEGQDDEIPVSPTMAISLSDVDDPISNIIGSGRDYMDAAERENLPAELRPIVDALAVLASANPSNVAMMVQYETRGIARLLPIASQNTARMLSTIEAQPWLLSRLV